MTPSTNPARDEAVSSVQLSNDEAVAFLTVCADYFERRPTDGEDDAHWSNISNGRMCRKIATMLTAAKPSASGVDAVAVKDLGPIPQFDSFAINPVGEGDICVEGSSRFAHERDVAKLFKWARAAQALLASLSPAATSGSESGGVAVAWRWRYDGEKAWSFRKSKPDEWPDVEMQPLYLAKPSSPAGGGVVDSVALSIDSDMRNSDFETWACKRGYLMHLHEGDESRRYRYSLTEEAWLGWCAALESSHDR